MHLRSKDWQVQCERCLFYIATVRIEEHKKECEKRTKKEIKAIQKGNIA